MAIKHTKVATVADDGTSEVGTNEWNDDHTIDNGTITNDQLAGSITPTKVTGTSAILGANTFTAKQTMPLCDVLQSGLDASVGIEVGNDNASSTTAVALIDLKVNGGDYDTRIIRQGGDNGNLQIENTGTGKIHLANQDVQMDTTKKLYLDGGSDTYIQENSADSMSFYTNGTQALTIASNQVVFAKNGLSVDSGDKLFLDGGGDTYIKQTSANVLDIFVGGTARGNFTSDVATFYNVRPPTNVTYDLGTASLKYRKLYVDDVEGIQNLVHDVSGGALAIDFSADQLQTLTITNNSTFTTSNRATGKSKTYKLYNSSGSSTYTLTFPAWKFVGAKPADIAPTKTAILTITSFGTTDADCVAAYAVEE